MNDFEQLNNSFLQHQMIHEQMRHDQYLRQQEEIRRQQIELKKESFSVLSFPSTPIITSSIVLARKDNQQGPPAAPWKAPAGYVQSSTYISSTEKSPLTRL